MQKLIFNDFVYTKLIESMITICEQKWPKLFVIETWIWNIMPHAGVWLTILIV